MATDHLGPHLAFDKGIDRITYARQGETQSLPRRQEAAPSDLGTRPQLDALLAQPTLEDFLEKAIRPQLRNPELMVPSRFQSVLDSVHSRLAESLKGAEGRDKTPWSADEQRVLQRAVRLLSSERDLRDMVQMYRSVLYQG